MSKILRDLLLVVAGFLAIWLVFTLIPWDEAESPLDYPLDKEEALGEVLIETIVSDNPDEPLVQHDFVDSTIYAIASRLLQNLDSTDYQYRFYVLETSNINAFALPGGHIVIHSELIEFAEGPEEVAAVLAHEIGHIENKHVIKRLGKEFGIQLLFGILTGGDPMIISEISKSATSTYFDRQQEKDADEFALDLLVKSEINPMYLGTFFRRLKRKYPSELEIDVFQTHPNTSSRIQDSFRYANDTTITTTPFDIEWSAVQDSLAVAIQRQYR